MSVPNINAREPTTQNRRNAGNVSFLFTASPVVTVTVTVSRFVPWSMTLVSGMHSVAEPQQGVMLFFHMCCHPSRFFISKKRWNRTVVTIWFSPISLRMTCLSVQPWSKFDFLLSLSLPNNFTLPLYLLMLLRLRCPSHLVGTCQQLAQ